MILGHWPKSHIFPLKVPYIPSLSLLSLYGQLAVPKILADFQNCHFGGTKLGHWPKVPKVPHIHSFYPTGWKLSLFSLYGQWFLRYRPISKLPY